MSVFEFRRCGFIVLFCGCVCVLFGFVVVIIISFFVMCDLLMCC